MKRWISAVVMCLFGASAANAEYVIIRVLLNKGPAGGHSTSPSGPGNPGGMIGGPPPGPGIPGAPGGMLGMIGGPPPGPGIPGAPGGGMRGGGPGAPGGPPPGPGVPGAPGGMLGMIGGPPPGPGVPGAPGGGMRGGPPPGPGAPGGGATGFTGSGPGLPGGPGFPGFPGGGAGITTETYTLNPDDFVTVVVPVTRLEAIQPGMRWGYGPDGKAEHIGVQGNFHFHTKYGRTYIDANAGDIIFDYRGHDKTGIDRYPDPKKQLARNRTDSKKYGSPEGQVQLAEWCLEVGLPDEAAGILDRLQAHPAKDTFRPSTTAAVEAYGKIKDVLSANVDKSDKAGQWKERLGYQALTPSKHYAIVHQDNTQKSAERRLEALENNFKTVYLWFAIRGRALPAPSEKMVAVIVGDSTEFRRYRDTFEATNLVADGFHARRENLAVFSARRLDRASVNFEQRVKDIYRDQRAEDLFKPSLPKLKDNPKAPNTYRKYANASTLALVDNLLQEEAEIAAATHEGTKQIFAETGLLPRNVLAPEWTRFGIAALFEMPKGPFPGSTRELQVAMYPGGGGPNWAYMRYFEELRDTKRLTGDNAPDLFIDTVTDEHFRVARKLDAAARAGKREEEGDSKATQAERQYAKARTLAWSVVYFLAKTHFKEFEAYLAELAKLPRDAELDHFAVIVAFCKAYGIDETGLSGASVDINKFAGVGFEWINFMGTQQSPSRKLKLDAVVVDPSAGQGGGGFPGGGGGFPGGGGVPGFPGGGGGVPGFPGGGGGVPGFPGGGEGRPGG